MSISPPFGWPRQTSSGSGSKLALLVAAGMVLIAGAGIGAGLLIWHEPTGRTDTGDNPPAGVTTAMPKVTGGLDTSSRKARIGPAAMTLPTEPYELYPDPMQVDGFLSVIFLANAEVHEDYRGHRDWLATVALAQVSPELTDGSDLESIGTRVMRELGTQFFGGQETTIKHMRSADRSTDGHPGLELRAEVHYRASGLASTYDSVTVRLLQLDDGSVIAAISSLPNDTQRQAADLAASAMDSLTVS